MSERVSRVLIAFSLLASFLYGVACARYQIFPYGVLRSLYHSWFRVAGALEASVEPHPEAGSRSSLLSLPYLQGYLPASGRQGVTVYEKSRTYDGLNLFISGHAPEAFLVDMTGRILHRWRCDFQRVWPGRRVEPQNRGQDRFWRRVHLLENGDLLAIFERVGLIRVDKDSKLLWAYDGGGHHDVSVADDGLLYLLTRRMREKHVIEDFVTVLDGGGRILRDISLLRCFQNSSYASLLDRMPARGDLFHTNRLQIVGAGLAGRSPLLRRGHALISVPTLDTIAIVDLERERAVWALSGMWRFQHDPTLLESGRMLVFDNGWDRANQFSRVVEIDPLTQEIVWDYGGDARNPFFSAVCGGAQRLPNGNTLIVESTRGRAFEVAPDKEIVWEFLNPFRDPEHQDRVATLYGLTRLPTGFPFPVSEVSAARSGEGGR